jgi:hypothetical protein
MSRIIVILHARAKGLARDLTDRRQHVPLTPWQLPTLQHVSGLLIPFLDPSAIYSLQRTGRPFRHPKYGSTGVQYATVGLRDSLGRNHRRCHGFGQPSKRRSTSHDTVCPALIGYFAWPWLAPHERHLLASLVPPLQPYAALRLQLPSTPIHLLRLPRDHPLDAALSNDHWTIGDDPLAFRKPTLSGFPTDFPATSDEKATADAFEKALLQHLCPALGPDTPISISSIADRALGHTRAPLTAVLVRATLADDQGLPGPPFLIVLALPTTAIDRIPVPFSLRPGRNP